MGTILPLILAMITSTVALTPAFAKDLNYPSGVNRIDYYNAGGEAELAVLQPLPTNYPASTTSMRLSFFHVEMPNAGLSFDGLLVWYYIITTGQTVRTWQPFAYVTDNADYAAFFKTFWTGSLVEFNATLIGLPASFNTDNVKLVSEDVLTVERHGNSVTVSLNAPQQIKRPSGPSVYFTLPAFNLELNKYGGSIHATTTKILKGYLGASNYTFINEAVGFGANGVFTATGLNLNTGPVENATVAMYGTHTYFPPE